MRKKFRFLTVLAVCVMVLSCFSVTAEKSHASMKTDDKTVRIVGSFALTA